MKIDTFVASLLTQDPPRELPPSLRALWFDHHHDWERAHQAIQHEPDRLSAAIHAYLHRKEGDIWNANYWYRTARKKPYEGPLENEWNDLVADACDTPHESISGQP